MVYVYWALVDMCPVEMSVKTSMIANYGPLSKLQACMRNDKRYKSRAHHAQDDKWHSIIRCIDVAGILSVGK